MPRELARSIAAPLPPRSARRPPDGRLYPPVRRPTSARGGRSCSNGSAATCSVSGPLKTSGSSAGDTNGEPVMPRGPRRTPPAAPAPFPPRSASVRKLRADGAERASSCDARPPDRTRGARAPPRTRRGPRAHRLAPHPDRRRHHRHVRLQRRGAVRLKAQRASAVAGRSPQRDPVVDLANHSRVKPGHRRARATAARGRGSRPPPGCARPTGRPPAGRASSRPPGAAPPLRCACRRPSSLDTIVAGRR